MGKSRHANSRATTFLEEVASISRDGKKVVALGTTQVTRHLNMANAWGGPAIEASAGSLAAYVEAAVFLDYMSGTRTNRALDKGGSWWVKQGPSIVRWYEGWWPNVARVIGIKGAVVRRGRLGVEIDCGADGYVLPDRVVVDCLTRVGKMNEASRVAHDGGLTARTTIIARGSNTASVASLRKRGATAYDAVLVKHSVQLHLLAECGKIAGIIARKRPARLLFATAGRVGREAYRGDVELMAALGVAVAYGTDGGAVEHRATGGIAAVATYGRHIHRWWLVPDAVGVGWVVPGTQMRLVSPEVADHLGLKCSFEIVGGRDRTLLHLVGTVALLAPQACVRLRHSEDDHARLKVGGKLVKVTARRLGRLPGSCPSAVAAYSAALARGTSYAPRGKTLAFVKKFAGDANLEHDAAAHDRARVLHEGSHERARSEPDVYAL